VKAINFVQCLRVWEHRAMHTSPHARAYRTVTHKNLPPTIPVLHIQDLEKQEQTPRTAGRSSHGSFGGATPCELYME